MVYLLDRSGVMHIVKAGSEFKLVAESPLGEAADCTPAFSDKKIYIRGKEKPLLHFEELNTENKHIKQ